MRSSFLALVLALLSPAAYALVADAPLPDPAQESRARALFYEIRCVVCQGESVADSPAEVARDVRRAIRDEIANGASDEQVKQLLVSRYGEHILMRPPFHAGTLLLWLAPLLLLAGGALLMRRYFRSAGAA